jgi:arabinose-5-phosphate isomerase
MGPKAIRAFLKKQIEAVASVAGNGKKLGAAAEVLFGAGGKIVVSGIGKSGHIGMKIASSMTSLGIPAVFVHAAEAFHGDLGMIAKSDAVIVLSHSGETKETIRLLQHLKRIGAAVVAITGNARSTLAKEAAVALTYRIKDEGSPYGIAPMASTTAMLVLGDMLACSLCDKCGFTPKDFAASHPGGTLGLQLTKVSEVMKGKERLPVVPGTATFGKAVAEINRHRLGVTAVVDAQGRVAGVVTDGDVRRFLLDEAFDMATPVARIMTRKPKTIPGDTSLHEALRLMEDLRVMSLFVVDARKRPVGTVHMHHIVEGKLV